MKKNAQTVTAVIVISAILLLTVTAETAILLSGIWTREKYTLAFLVLAAGIALVYLLFKAFEEKTLKKGYDKASEEISLLEDYIKALSKCNLNAGNVSSNSMFVANDEKQREKMTAEFYMNYKRDIEIYEERIQHFIDNGCSSAAVINRWLKKIEALKAKKTTYEQVLKRRLDDLDKDFSLLQMQSQELSLRAVKNQTQMPLAA